jgi:predicted 2-oxoglutarate/Fe(II)-dependent dioxygenase YbiX
MKQETQGLGRGERAPAFVLRLQQGTPTRFYAIAGGRPVVLIFCESDRSDMVRSFSTQLEAGAPGRVSVFAVQYAESLEASSQETSHADHGFLPVFCDVDGKVRTAYRLPADGGTMLYLLDPNLRVLEALSLADPGRTARAITAIVADAFPETEPVEVLAQAPVLLIPNILPPQVCAELMDVWENQGNVETGVEQSHAGRREDIIRPDRKRRRDHIVQDDRLMRRLISTIGRRVMPEVWKAFAFQATRFEGFKIVCYDAAAGGFFRAHRDNLSPSTAHRRFALTLNLNDDYEGGHLRFPEYGSHLYRPETGCALLFSCAHLHEVTEVTEGRRFALLSFLFGDAEVRNRQKSKG